MLVGSNEITGAKELINQVVHKVMCKEVPRFYVRTTKVDLATKKGEFEESIFERVRRS